METSLIEKAHERGAQTRAFYVWLENVAKAYLSLFLVGCLSMGITVSCGRRANEPILWSVAVSYLLVTVYEAAGGAGVKQGGALW